MKKESIVFLVLTIISLTFYACEGKKNKKTTEQPKQEVTKSTPKKTVKDISKEKIAPSQKDIKTSSKPLKKNISSVTPHRKYPTINIAPHQKITSPVKIEVNSQGIWLASEGELGTVEIVDENNRVLNLKDNLGILFTADGNWMHSKPALFKTEISFDAKGAKSGKIIIHNHSGEGDGDESGVADSFEIPVVF